MNFKTGDKVRLRDDLELEKYYGKIKFLSGMKRLKGKEMTIDRTTPQGNYKLKESLFNFSEEMLEKTFNSDDLLEFVLNKFNIDEEELREEYKKNKADKQVLEHIKKRSKDFTSYCSARFCMDCEVRKFKKDNNFEEMFTGDCILIYEYLLKGGC